ncbi:MAG: dienelactone hydrolase family protein [Dehalococcoidia bacterium]
MEVRVSSGERSFRAELALPPGAGPFPGVVVIHEAFGLNRDIREKAHRFAAMGYAALAPDLLEGRGPKPICIVRLMRELGRGRGLAFDDLDACSAYLAERPEVDRSRIGVAGFCMGGGFALLYAARAPVGAAAVFYGAVPKDEQELEDVCPVVGGYGERDRTFARQGRRLVEILERRGVPHDVAFYPEAGHSYMSEHRGVLPKIASWGPMKIGFNALAAEDSWARIERFFGEHLGVGG